MPWVICRVVSLSRRTSDQPAGAVMAVPAPPRTVTWAIITSLATTPAGTGIVTWLLAPEVLPVATLRNAIEPGTGVAVGVPVGVAVTVTVGVGVGVGPVNPYTSSSVVLPTYTFPLATVGTVNLMARPG